MNRLTKSAAGLILGLCAISFSGCDDDEPNVIGLNDAAKYGNIKLTFDGTRPDGEDFTVTKNYRFITGAGPASSSTVETMEDGFVEYDFHVTRMFDAFDGSPSSATVDLTARLEEGEIDVTEATVRSNSSLVFGDNTAFTLYIDPWSIDPDDITSYSYNESTGKLIIKFITEVSDDYNNSGSNITVTGEVRVTVYTSLNSGR